MKIVGVAMVRNEADIIETFVRYHLQFCDQLILTDHQSSDGCTEILEAMAADDTRLLVLHDRRSGLFQREVMTRTMRTAARELRADWVLPLDGDEFLASDSRIGARQAIENLPTGRAVRIPWRTYVPRPEDRFRNGNLLAQIQHRRAREAKVFYKVLVPGCLAEKESTELRTGSHGLLDTSRIRPRTRGIDTPDLFLGHFPVRSSSQIIKKAVIGWLSRIAAPEHARVISYNAGPLFRRLKSGKELSAKELMDMAFAYPSKESHFPPTGKLVAAPIRYDSEKVTLRHESLIHDDPSHALVKFTEVLARELSERPTAEPCAVSRSWKERIRNALGFKVKHRVTGGAPDSRSLTSE